MPFKLILSKAKFFFWMAALIIGSFSSILGVGIKSFYFTRSLPEPVTIVIPSGEGSQAIAQRLQTAHVIGSGWAFQVGALLTGHRNSLKAGEYEFPAGVAAYEALDLLVRGKTKLHKLTIPEGLTTRQVMALVQADANLQGEVKEVYQEGELLPETYCFTYGETRDHLLERMKTAMAETLQKTWSARDPRVGLSQEETIVLASIVEKETSIAMERPRVAAVFLNRLRIGMPLQADPCVLYGLVTLGHDKSTISKADLSYFTPYNTYLNKGLPPTPIANPGKASIVAVLHPAETEEFYFVADGTGGHRFSGSLNEHQKNHANWRRIRK